MSDWGFWVSTPSGGLGAVPPGSPLARWGGRQKRPTDEQAERCAVTTLASVGSQVRLDAQRCVWTPNRLSLSGTVEADSPDRALGVVLFMARWTLHVLYGQPVLNPQQGVESMPLGDVSVSVRPVSGPSLRDAAWLRRRYVDDGASLRDIAREVGCVQAAVRQALSRYGIPVREGGPRPVLAGLSADEALALVREHGIGGAAESLGVSRATFTITLGRLEALDKAVELSQAWRAEVMPRESWWPHELRDPALLADLYDHLSALQIGKLLGVHRTTVSAALDAHGIPRRSTNVRPPKAPARAVVGEVTG